MDYDAAISEGWPASGQDLVRHDLGAIPHGHGQQTLNWTDVHATRETRPRHGTFKGARRNADAPALAHSGGYGGVAQVRRKETSMGRHLRAVYVEADYPTHGRGAVRSYGGDQDTRDLGRSAHADRIARSIHWSIWGITLCAVGATFVSIVMEVV